MRLAAIDLGTVTSRLLIADVSDGRILELSHMDSFVVSETDILHGMLLAHHG